MFYWPYIGCAYSTPLYYRVQYERIDGRQTRTYTMHHALDRRPFGALSVTSALGHVRRAGLSLCGCFRLELGIA